MLHHPELRHIPRNHIVDVLHHLQQDPWPSLFPWCDVVPFFDDLWQPPGFRICLRALRTLRMLRALRRPWTLRTLRAQRIYMFKVVLVAWGVCEKGVWCVYGCDFSWRFQRHLWRPCQTLAARDIAIFVILNFLLSLAAIHLHGVLDMRLAALQTKKIYSMLSQLYSYF